MFVPNEPFLHENGVAGPSPTMWYGPDVVDGDASPWNTAGIGSCYYKVDHTNTVVSKWTKEKNDGADNDWVQGLGCITETVSYSDFTDGGSTTGTFVLTDTIPQGAFVLHTTLVDVTGFTGDTSATLQVGDGTDVDRYSTGTPSVFTTANAIDMGVVSGTEIHTSAATVTLTVTSNSDFTSVSAGQLTIRIYYLA